MPITVKEVLVIAAMLVAMLTASDWMPLVVNAFTCHVC